MYLFRPFCFRFIVYNMVANILCYIIFQLFQNIVNEKSTVKIILDSAFLEVIVIHRLLNILRNFHIHFFNMVVKPVSDEPYDLIHLNKPSAAVDNLLAQCYHLG